MRPQLPEQRRNAENVLTYNHYWEADVRRPCLGAIRTGIQMKHEEVDSRIIQ